MELNILIIGSSRTGKTTLSNALYNHPQVENTQSHIIDNSTKPSLSKVTNVSKKYNLKILSTSSFTKTTTTAISSKDSNNSNVSKRKKKFDFIICIFDITNINSFNFIKSFLMDNNELDEDYFSMNKIQIVVSREDLKGLISISFNELESICEQLNIQFYISNLTDPNSRLNLVNKIINHISLNHFNLIDNFTNNSNNSSNNENNLQINKILFDTLDTPFITSTEINQS
ncbi:hypothetical protein DICPUDRAFT_149252 [Dictyostelium purpureum]|uniref:Uncharacterized protein n=1 Tax=Dictyostelium purpureum TaxID=5786 RepID=F0ZD76_DICPU|nr:uncharacterized protein DICPUDRAFT_149252 [Dictyostelium purpureum]EGC38087.1 hypothetical protein DICPUDRAFT_149252 [Dictyostelium purpureum]|eukprot:XP_003285394.1 hypothetical protein DICPUDRAFT_149252 [Dictyostelium purpureum]